MAISPFQNYWDSASPASVYSGPLFNLNHIYPSTFPLLPVLPSWRKTLGNTPISSRNALAHVDSLKAYVTPAVRKFLYDRENWNAAAEQWYQEPWTETLREAILGSYVGSSFGNSAFSTLGLAMTTYVLTMYDQRAANTLYKPWGGSAAKYYPIPVLELEGKKWFNWFQDRKGTAPFTSGQIAVDFDMVTCFKSMLMMYSLQKRLVCSRGSKSRFEKEITFRPVI